MVDRIIENGRERLLQAPEVQEKIAAVRREVEAQYTERYATAGCIKRRILRWKMEREIARRIEQIAPSDALYLQQP